MAAGGLASARTASFRRADAHTQSGMKIECEARIEVPAVCFPPHAKCEGPLYKYKIDTGVDQKLRDLCSRVCRCVDDPTKVRSQSLGLPHPFPLTARLMAPAPRRGGSTDKGVALRRLADRLSD